MLLTDVVTMLSTSEFIKLRRQTSTKSYGQLENHEGTVFATFVI